MDVNEKNRTVLITGASKEIAKSVAMSMAAEGYNLHLVSHTFMDLESTVIEITDRYPVEVHLHDTDLSNSHSISVLLETAGVPDILINNAGAIPVGTLENIGGLGWLEAWELRVIEYINMCRAFYAAMKVCGYGVIINITGLAAQSSVADYITGTAGNAGLNTFTKKWGSHSLNDGIRVLSVSPGVVNTERLVALMHTRTEAKFENVAQWQSFLSKFPLGRTASIKECSEVVTLIVSDQANCMSGTVVTAPIMAAIFNRCKKPE
ncbi:MAG: SDR family oxidoreductase [Pseudomonadales bacterium]|nr:SDR family oxidoreductase [Pseudomonadales bacterium]